MTVINKAFLKFALLPSAVYRKMGVNTVQLRSILQAKLTIDDRRPNTMLQTSYRKKDKPVTGATIGTMIVSALMGLLYLLAFGIGSDMVTHLTVYFTFFFFMLSATLISDFTSVLIDVRDNYIILPKPVNDRTFMAARLLHIFIHICKLVLPMSLGGIVYMARETGVAGLLVFLVMLLFVTVFSIFFINALYILILRVTTPRRFQAIISYVQIFLAIAMYASYQILPSVIEDVELQDFNIQAYRWAVIYPVYWFAACWKVLSTASGSTGEIIVALAGLLLPFLSIWLVIRYLAPSFNNRLALISSISDTPSETKKREGRVKSGGGYASRLARIFTRSSAERMGFLLAWKMTARSRDFKLKVYPSIGYLAVYAIVIVMRSREMSLDDIRNEETSGKAAVISVLYFTSLLLIMAINQIAYSDKHKAAWIYYVSPVGKPGEVISGGAMAVVMKFFLPLAVFVVPAALAIAGWRILPNILLGLFNQLLIVALLVYAGKRVFPFSLHQNAGSRTGSFIRNLGVLGFSALVAIGHFLIYSLLPVVIICAVLSIGVTWMLVSSIRESSWETIKEMSSEG
jgi:ABC-2 type transport system permease protein